VLFNEFTLSRNEGLISETGCAMIRIKPCRSLTNPRFLPRQGEILAGAFSFYARRHRFASIANLTALDYCCRVWTALYQTPLEPRLDSLPGRGFFFCAYRFQKTTSFSCDAFFQSWTCSNQIST